jgi:hypothetical protein
MLLFRDQWVEEKELQFHYSRRHSLRHERPLSSSSNYTTYHAAHTTWVKLFEKPFCIGSDKWLYAIESGVVNEEMHIKPSGNLPIYTIPTLLHIDAPLHQESRSLMLDVEVTNCTR